ncbi:hypothetical protein KI440_02910 [Candidatus Saccharibacteria bacterium TM7i]|nr:hypothetical protein KI440_02910 [Candidatus Saccharibacteria bacterium TM7i]
MKLKKDLLDTALGFWLSVTVIYVTLIAYASSTSFKAGYLSYFHIDIKHVDYTPSIADLMNQPVTIILAIILLLIIYFAIILIINFLHWLLSKIANKKGWVQFLDLIGEKPFGRRLIIASLIALLLILSFKLPLLDSFSSGTKFAEQQKNFTTLVVDDQKKTIKVLIHQHEGIGLFKTYNTDSKTFNSSYEAIDLTNTELNYVQIQ